MVFNVKDKTLKQIRNRVLRSNERLMGVIENGMIICTDNRVVFYKSKSLGRYEAESIPLDHISYTRFSRGLFSGKLLFKTTSDEMEFPCPKDDGARINDIINNQILISKALASGATIPTPDPVMELQLMYVKGQVEERDYLRRMITL